MNIPNPASVRSSITAVIRIRANLLKTSNPWCVSVYKFVDGDKRKTFTYIESTSFLMSREFCSVVVVSVVAEVSIMV